MTAPGDWIPSHEEPHLDEASEDASTCTGEEPGEWGEHSRDRETCVLWPDVSDSDSESQLSVSVKSNINKRTI